MKWAVKSSRVIVGSADGDAVFASVEDCPEPLRQKIRDTLDGPQARTILIMNRETFERIAQDIRTLPPEMRAAVDALESAAEAAREPARLPPWYAIAGGFLATAAALFGLLLWAVRSA